MTVPAARSGENVAEQQADTVETLEQDNANTAADLTAVPLGWNFETADSLHASQPMLRSTLPHRCVLESFLTSVGTESCIPKVADASALGFRGMHSKLKDLQNTRIEGFDTSNQSPLLESKSGKS